jgi:hypothetical protein
MLNSSWSNQAADHAAFGRMFMSKLIVTILALALAGTAGAAGWRSLRVDASSEAAFEQSLAEFKDKLAAPRRQVFGEALKDIWVAGTKAAEAEQRDYTAADYYRQLDGLTYEEVVNFTDPTGDTANGRYRAAVAATRARLPAAPGPNWGSRPAGGWGTNAASLAQQQQQTGSMSPNGPQGN